MDESGLEWRRIVTKEHLGGTWWNLDVKEAIRAKKDAFMALLQNKSTSDLQSRYSEAQEATALAVKMSKERSWE